MAVKSVHQAAVEALGVGAAARAGAAAAVVEVVNFVYLAVIIILVFRWHSFAFLLQLFIIQTNILQTAFCAFWAAGSAGIPAKQYKQMVGFVN